MPQPTSHQPAVDTFATRLRAAMNARGMTQRTLASTAGLSESAVSQYLSGVREPNLRVLASLCSALDVSPSDLVPVTSCGTDSSSIAIKNAVSLVIANAALLTSEDRRSLVLAILDA